MQKQYALNKQLTFIIPMQSVVRSFVRQFKKSFVCRALNFFLVGYFVVKWKTLRRCSNLIFVTINLRITCMDKYNFGNVV